MARYKQFILVAVMVLIGGITLGEGRLVSAQAVAQGYSSDTALQIGMIVRLDQNDATKIDPVTQSTASKAQGVVVAPNDVTVSLSGNSNSQQYYVASTGEYHMLVSDQNGTIHHGDYLVVSSLAGVGMEDDSIQKTVIGKATEDFTGTGDSVLSTVTLKDNLGRQRQIHLGYVTATINVAVNPQQQQVTSAGLPGFLQRTGTSIANKQISYARAYISLGVLIVSAIIAGSILYAGVKTGMVAVGRNPLARKSIMRNLLQVIFTSLIVFVVGIFAVYLLLKL